MFHIVMLNLLIFVVLLVVSFWTSSLPGRNRVPAPSWNKVQDSDELERQFPDLRAEVYTQFERAVDFHLSGNLDEARRRYQSLGQAQKIDGTTIDLVNVKGPVQNNLHLLNSSSRKLSDR